MATKCFCFIGQTSGGKSTISGHLYAKCGMIDEHNLEKIQNTTSKTQKWSNIMDVCEEEQVKGNTHEFNIVELVYKNVKYNMIDTPGHKIFIRSLIEGISTDPSHTIACLLISMAKGEFEAGWINGQTKEDVLIARACGIEHLIVLINKMDLIDWSEELFNQIVLKISPFLKKCRFKTTTFIPISAYHGIGLLTTEGIPLWYKGVSLLDTIGTIQIETKAEIPLTLDRFTHMIVDIQILTSGIFTSGFQCIMHYAGGEYEVYIDRIIEPKVIFMKEDYIGKILIISRVPIYKQKTRRFLLRTDKTIGFGKINKVKFTESSS